MKRRVTVEVDDAALFEGMRRDPDFAQSFGYHMTSTLLTGKPPEFLDAVALQFYGVSFVEAVDIVETGSCPDGA